ncbi:Uncharacterized protein dnl_07460 [Desulfonema limicola]|uniref:Uncharacterized protein n=2 Tax=Desulfonema limicola TaxID=45656 RepID=A0A975GER7_9BACT|nr:Uncharacterized protein dnl_07460 [Desulfonema limicola]
MKMDLKKIIPALILTGISIFPQHCRAFKFDKWESGMSLPAVVELAQKENIVLYKSSAALTQKGIDPIARMFVNHQINPKFLEDVDRVSYGINLLKKWAGVTLLFTPTSKRLASIILQWTEYTTDGLKDRQFDPEFTADVRHSLEKKYGDAIEVTKQDDENILFKTYSCYWKIGGTDTISMTTDYKSLRLVYNNRTITELAEKESAVIEKQAAVKEKIREAEDKEKF